MEICSADFFVAVADFIMGPGGGLGCVVLYQWWRIYRLTNTASMQYREIKDLLRGRRHFPTPEELEEDQG